MATTRDPITTHVLDSTTGRPAAGVQATLTLLTNGQKSSSGSNSPSAANPTWTSTTSTSDGRINAWQGSTSLQDLVTSLGKNTSTTTIWSLRFDTERYWGGSDKTFYPEVEIRFFFNASGGHYHVPLLLGPWGYTTYRGS